MPTLPVLKPTLGNYNSAGIINAITQNENYQELTGLPVVSNTTDAIRMIGQEITGYAPRRNQFRDGLVNLIGMMRLTYMIFTNPWSDMKKGKLEMGETVEQIWVDLASVFPYDPAKSETRVLKRALGNVSTAFHSINFHDVYKITISTMELKRAFLSVSGVQDLVEAKMGSIFRANNLDEFMLMKYIFATLLLEGKINVTTIPAITKTTADEVVTQVATITNLFQFSSTNYNMAAVENTTPIDKLVIFESAAANAQIKVNALAVAFNREDVEFMGQVKMFDSLGTYNWDRMDQLLADDPGYQRFTDAQIALLNTVEIIACDREFLQIYDSVREMETPFINGEGAFTNYFYHVAEIFSASPFHNCVAYSTATSGVTSVAVSPATATLEAGQSLSLSVNVTTTGFGSSAVVWEITSTTTSDKTYVTQGGILRVGKDETAKSITVKVISAVDSTKSATATITIGATT